MVILAGDLPGREDIRNAAQAILISYVESRLMRNFKRPLLASGGEFYTEFFTAYVKAIREEELCAWHEIDCEVSSALAEQPDRDLTDKEAAYLTYAFLGDWEPPDSTEYCMNLAAFTRAYEELVREKYGKHYTPEIFYGILRKHMPAFVVRLIAMDSVISALLTINMQTKDILKDGFILSPTAILNPRFMGLGEDNSLFFLPKFINEVHEHARRQAMREDHQGRTEDRGCPVLYSSERDAIIRFAIEELIVQHRLYKHET